MRDFELEPAYGRDYKSSALVIEAFNQNKDFIGDHQLGFKYVNKSDLEREFKQGSVALRYNAKRKVVTVVFGFHKEDHK